MQNLKWIASYIFSKASEEIVFYSNTFMTRVSIATHKMTAGEDIFLTVFLLTTKFEIISDIKGLYIPHIM